MSYLHSKLFTRIISRNREVYALKIITLATAFASTILITLFSLNEFEFDRKHVEADKIFRVLQKNTDDQYNGNRLSMKVKSEVFEKFKSDRHRDKFNVARVKVMKKISMKVDHGNYDDLKVHAADPDIIQIFSFDAKSGSITDFNRSDKVKAMLSSQSAMLYFGTRDVIGKEIKLYTFQDTVTAKIVAVFRDFQNNSHEDFHVFITYNNKAINSLLFNPDESGIYGRTLHSNPSDYSFSGNDIGDSSPYTYSFQSLPEIYFGPRILGEEARHGDRYSIIIIICITGLILLLSLGSFINLTTITLPYRSKELAIKKLAGTSQGNLLLGFFRESSTLVGISLSVGFVILLMTNRYSSTILNVNVSEWIVKFDSRLILVIVLLFLTLAISPVFMTFRFIKATPNRLLRTDTITFPRLKRVMTFLQLGISIFLIIASVVIRRQINYSLVKEPGQNHDQIVYLNAPNGITNAGIQNLRDGWRKNNPNILDVMAVSQLPDRIMSKEIGTDFYLLQVDRGFQDFFKLSMQAGYWFGPNSNDNDVVINTNGNIAINQNQSDKVIGTVSDLSNLFNQPEKPVKIKIAQDYHYNWLCVRILEVDIRRTVNRLAETFSSNGKPAQVRYLNNHFKSWIEYQDKLNALSGLLAIVAAVLSCFAIYGLSVSLVRDKLKEIAVHKLFGAHTFNITYLLAREFIKQMFIALAVFGPLAFLVLNELLRSFVYATHLTWSDPAYPIMYCTGIIIIICSFQASSLNRTNFAAALKS